MPALLTVRRTLRVTVVAAAFAAGPAAAAPPSVATQAAAPERHVIAAENNIIPRWLGGDRRQQVRVPDNTSVRIDQLETQVRNLTGGVLAWQEAFGSSK